MEAFFGIIILLAFLFLIVFPVICLCKLKRITNQLDEIEYRINLLRIDEKKESIPKTAQLDPERSKPFATAPPIQPAEEKPETAPAAPPQPAGTYLAAKTQTYSYSKTSSREKSTAGKKTETQSKLDKALDKQAGKINEKLSDFEERSAKVFKHIWSWICVGEEFRNKDVAKEYAIATTWLIRLGVIILLCGIGFFLKYSIDRNWTPPVVRVALMVVAGLAMAVTGSWKSQGKYRQLAIAVAGAGFVTLYLSTMAAYKLYELIPALPAFGFMIVVTLGAMASALGTNALLTALLGCTGGYLTPVFISTGSNNITALFIYMTILGAGTLIAARYRNWLLLNGASFLFYAAIGGTAVARYLSEENALPLIGLIALNYTVFGIQNFTASAKRDMSFAEVLLFCGNIFFYLAAALPGAVQYCKEWEIPALLTIFAAALAAGKIFFILKKAELKKAEVLTVFLQIELCFSLALTVPLLFGTQWVIAAWSVLAFLLIDAAIKVRSKTLIVFAVATYIAAAWFETYTPQAFLDNYEKFLPQLLNMFLTAGIYIASMTASAIKLLKNTGVFASENHETNQVVGGLAQIFIAIAGFLFFYCSSYELHMAMHYNFIVFKAGILVAYWSVLVAVTAYLINKYRLYQLCFVPLALLALAGIWMFINSRTFPGEFWKGFAYTLATAGIYISAAALAGREFFKISNQASSEKLRINTGRIALILYALSGILFFVYSSSELHKFLISTLSNFRNGGLSVYWSALAFALLAWGLRKQRKILRMCGIGLFCVVAFKIFIIDLAGLEQIWRIVAFAAIGVVMLIGAVVYIRCKDMFINKEGKNE